MVESSVFGRGLYEKNGFVFQKDVKVTGPNGENGGSIAWLIRPKKQ